MNENTWRRKRNDRTLRYAGRTLDDSHWICIKVAPDYAEQFDGQVATLVLVNLLGRMTPAIALDIPKTSVHPALPSKFSELSDALLDLLKSADPWTKAICRTQQIGDFVITLGSQGTTNVVHGSGWNSYIGPGPSPITPSDDLNPFGAALAAIMAARELFARQYSPFQTNYQFNSLNWNKDLSPQVTISHLSRVFLGDIWTVGAGSVGTAALFFLSLFTRNFRVSLVDMDSVKIENLDRSPIFTESDVGCLKVEATKKFLEAVGVSQVQIDKRPLHESELWLRREASTPDILISSANELNVRYHIESGYPPVQIYGTTGENWQASLIRHIPLLEACSCCVFPSDKATPLMKCATVPIEMEKNQEQVDATLPFLSFAAGLMTAAEIVKLSLEGFPLSQNKVTFSTHPNLDMRLIQYAVPERSGCICNDRSLNVYRKMIQGSKYANLSDTEKLEIANS